MIRRRRSSTLLAILLVEPIYAELAAGEQASEDWGIRKLFEQPVAADAEVVKRLQELYREQPVDDSFDQAVFIEA
jgi:hypothetical protein